MSWLIEENIHDNCPHQEYDLFIPEELDKEIFDVYRYGLRHNIEIAIYGVIEDNELTDLYIPDQENTSVQVRFNEVIPLKFNCIIHSHPNGCRTFSGPDKNTLLNNRDYCLLICEGQYTDSNARITTPCGCRLNAKINVIDSLDKYEKYIVPKEYTQKIEPDTLVTDLNEVWPEDFDIDEPMTTEKFKKYYNRLQDNDYDPESVQKIIMEKYYDGTH